MEAILLGVRWMDLEFDYFVRRFKGGGLGSFVEYHIVPIHRGAQRDQFQSLGFRIVPQGPVRLSCFRRGVLCPDH